MDLPNYAGTTDVEDLVEFVEEAKHVVEECVFVNQTVPTENVVMMAAVTNPVEPAPQLRVVSTAYAQAQQLLSAQAEFVVQTELEEIVEHAPLVKDAEEDFVNVIMTATKETVETQSKLLEPISDSAHQGHVAPAHPVSVVLLKEDALHLRTVMSMYE